jgi:hypothetical protein
MESLMTLVPLPTETRVLLTRGRERLLRASLPPLGELRHRRAATALLEALSLWLDERLSVAVCADDLELCFKLGLADELGAGARSVFYAVEVVAPPRRRHRREPAVVRETADGRQLCLVAQPGEGR